MELTRWHRIRMRVYLFGSGLARRMTLGVRVMLIDGNRIYLVRHTYVPGWQFPGGGVEPGESAEAAAAREVREETGLAVVGRPHLHALFYNLHPSTNRDHVAFYIWRAFEEGPAFQPNHEIAEAGWFAIDALPDETTPGTLRRVAEVFGGEAPSERW